MASNVHRAISDLNTKMGLAPAGYSGGTCTDGVFCPPINNQGARKNGDPFTPIMRTNDGDKTHVKMQAGGQEEEHAAIVHGLKWLQGGSGFGEAKNSGWRNAQSGGISEQFALRTPIFADFGQRGQEIDYAYSFNSSIDGWVNGTWGILRSSKNSSNLFPLPDNDTGKPINIVNKKDFDKVCPKSAPNRDFDITAVAANDVLSVPDVDAMGTKLVVTDLFPGAHVGGSPDGGGTLTYNPRFTTVNAGIDSRGGYGPLHDSTALIYVNTDDLIADDAYLDSYRKKGKDVYFWNSNNPYCINGKSGVQHRLTGCPVKLRPAEPYTDSNYNGQYDEGEPFTDVAMTRQATAGPNGVYDGEVAIEPIVLRANAGDCMDVTLRNKVLQPGTYTDSTGTYRVYRNNFNAPAFYEVPGFTYVADLNGDGVLDAGTESIAGSSVDWDQTLDMASGNAIAAFQRRERGMDGSAQGMTSFQSNLMQPSAHVGLLPQLVEYDVSRSDGTNVGGNPAQQSVVPGGQETYQWYAGKIDIEPASGPGSKRNIRLVATPIEFGGFNLMPTDKIEQGQKGLVGAGVIYPEGSTWEVDPGTNTAATITAPLDPAYPDAPGTRTFRDFTTIAVKGASMFYQDSYPVENILGEGDFGIAEDAQDMGHMNINYGNEAMWFRFGRNPTEAGGNALCGGAGAGVCLGGVPSGEAARAFSNTLVNSEPETAVFTVAAGTPFRMHALMPFSPGRGSTFDLHGHVFQRDPYICPGDADLGLPGKCDMGSGAGDGHAGAAGNGSVGSQNLGDNPIGFHLGGIESWFSGQHYEIVIPSAGGANAVTGDYLFRDHMGLGNAGGLWGILRVE